MNEKKAIKQFLFAISIVTLFALAAVIVCTDQDVDATGPAIVYVDYASDSGANPSLKVYISGLDPVLDINKNVDYVLSGPESDFNRTKIRNIDESGVGYISITGLSGTLIKGNYTITVSNCDDKFGFSLYRLNLTDAGSSGFADKTVIISDHYLSAYLLSNDYSWNTEADGSGKWISVLDSSLFESYTLTLYAFERMTATFTGESEGVGYDGNPHTLTGITDNLNARYSYSGLSYLAEGTDVGSYPGKFTGSAVIIDTYYDDMVVTGSFDITYVPGTLTVTGGMIIPDPVFDIIETVYDGKEHSTEIPGGDYYYTEQAVGTSAGTYKVTFVLKNKSSYIWKSTGLSDDLSLNALVIDKAASVYTAPTAKDIQTYTGEPLELINAGTSTTPGAFTYSTAEAGPFGIDIPTATEPGTYSVWFRFTPDDAIDYESVGTTLVSDKIRIIMGYVTVTITGNTDSKVYNGDEQSVTGFTYDYSEDIMVTLKEGKSAVASGTDAGIYYMGLDDSMFEWTSDDYIVTGFIVIDGSLTVSHRPATITADDKEKTYGTEDPEFTVSVDGVLEGDSVAYKTLSREAGEASGKYDIIVTGDEIQGNYSVTFKNGTLTITAKEIDKPTAAEGLVFSGEEQTGVPSGEGYTLTGTYKAVSAGEYKATATLSDGCIWSDGSAEPVDLIWSIARKDVTVTADNKGKAAGASDPVLTATVEGVVDEYAITYSLEREPGEDIGEYTIFASGDAIQGNYSVAYKNGILKITVGIPIDKPKALIGLIYNGEEQTGVPSGEGYVLSGKYKATYAGEYTATATLEDGYIWSDDSAEPVDVVWIIAPKNVTVTADDRSKSYGEDDPELTATVEGVIDGYKVKYVLERAAGESVGKYTIAVSGEEIQGNYFVDYFEGVFTISGTSIDRPTAATGLVYNGSEQTGVPSGTGYTLTGDKGTKAGNYTATATLAEGYQWSDGSIEPSDISWAIGKKALDNSMVSVTADFTYDGTEHTVSYTVSDKSGGKEIITADDYSLTSGDKGTDAGQYALILDAADSGNYYGQMSAAWSIAQRGAAIKVDDKSKVYGQDDPELTGTVIGLISEGDLGDVVFQRIAGENVGEYDIDASYVPNPNYTVTVVKGKLTITPKTATVTADDKEKKLGEDDPELTAKVEGVIDDYAIVYELSRAAGETVGEYAITATGDAVQGNYTVEYVAGTFTIISTTVDVPVGLLGLIYNGSEQVGVESGTGYTLTGETAVNAGNYTATATLWDGYTWSDGSSDPASIPWSIAQKKATVTADDQSKEYGDTDPVFTAKVEGVIDDYALVYTVSRDAGEAVGTYDITVSGEASQGNYAVTYVKGTFTIIGKTIDVPVGLLGLIYNASEQAGVESGEGYTLTGEIEVNAGNYTATATLKDGYIWSGGSTEPVSIPWSIAQKKATVTADDKSKTYGEEDPVLTATVEGVIDDYALVYKLSRAAGETIGTYDITVSGEASQGNYAVTFVEGTFTVVPAKIDVPVGLLGLVYNGSPQSGVPSGTGYTLKGEVAVDAGDYTAMATLEDGYTWSDGSVEPAGIQWSIARKSVTVTADDKEKEFETQDPALTAKVEGVIDNYAIVYTVTRDAGEAVGTYTITPSGDVEQGNYAVTYKNGTLTIVYAERTVVDDKGRSSVDGQIAPGSVLTVTERYEPSDWEGIDLSGKDIRGKYDIKLENATMKPFTGELEVTIDVGSDLNGSEVTVYHHGTNGIEQFVRTVQDGKVTVTVSDLSPFIATHSNTVDPGTGIATGVIIAIVVIVLIVGIAAVILYKKKTV